MGKDTTITLPYIRYRLRSFSNHWPKEYQLFAAPGGLYLIRLGDGKVIERFSGINCDGGDPNFVYDEDGNEYIEFIKI